MSGSRITLTVEFEFVRGDIGDGDIYAALGRVLPTPRFGLTGRYTVTSIKRADMTSVPPINAHVAWGARPS